jgi:hypothetical protein
MNADENTFTERKAAGGALMKAIHQFKWEGKASARKIGSIGGFDLHLDLVATLRRETHTELTMQRHGHVSEIVIRDDMTALGIISSLEYVLSRFEVELIEQKRTQAECLDRIPHYEAQKAEPFSYQAELDDKLRELEELNASLAQTTGEDESKRSDHRIVSDAN